MLSEIGTLDGELEALRQVARRGRWGRSGASASPPKSPPSRSCAVSLTGRSGRAVVSRRSGIRRAARRRVFARSWRRCGRSSGPRWFR